MSELWPVGLLFFGLRDSKKTLTFGIWLGNDIFLQKMTKNGQKLNFLSLACHPVNTYPVTKVSDLGLWKGYSYLSMLFPSFSIALIHIHTYCVSMDWLTINTIVMLHLIASHVTNQETYTICGHCKRI